MGYFEQALSDFARNFAYGDAIRHLVDRGYDADRIIKEFKYPIPQLEIRRMAEQYEKQKMAEKQKEKPQEKG